MTRPLRATIPHSLGKDEARRRIHDGFANLQQQASGSAFGLVSLQRRWEGDCLHLAGGMFGQKVTGRLEVLADSVVVEVDLPAMLVALAERITGVVTTETRRLLEKK